MPVALTLNVAGDSAITVTEIGWTLMLGRGGTHFAVGNPP